MNRASFANCDRESRCITFSSVHNSELTQRRICNGCAAFATMRSTASGQYANHKGMEKTAYNRRRWRNLPREFCTVEHLFGDAAGPCHGLIQLHHVDENDPDSRSVPCCARHHPSLQAALRRFRSPETEWRKCRHRHTTPEGRAACEKRLNRDRDLQSAA